MDQKQFTLKLHLKRYPKAGRQTVIWSTGTNTVRYDASVVCTEKIKSVSGKWCIQHSVGKVNYNH